MEKLKKYALLGVGGIVGMLIANFIKSKIPVGA